MSRRSQEVQQVQVDAPLPSIAECSDLFWLASDLSRLAIFHVALSCRYLQVDPNLMPYGGSK